MILLDLFCGAGGAGEGYRRAGFEIIGVDRHPQPRYPGRFIQGDALIDLPWILAEFRPDVVHASPPCQAFAKVTKWRGRQSDHPELIGPTRSALERAALPFVLENVPGAPLRPDFILCGTMFGLRVQRHRLFELSFPHAQIYPAACGHRPDDYAFDHGAKQTESVYRAAMGCDWMTVKSSRQAIPPAYTEFVGAHLHEYALRA